jgi:NADH-quinone oxidoreductase subunit N
VEGRSYALAGIAMLAAAVAAFVYLRILVALYMEAEGDAVEVDVAPWGPRIVIAVSVALVLFLGVVPGPLIDLARDAVPVLVGG